MAVVVVVSPVRIADLCGQWNDPNIGSSFKCSQITTNGCDVWRGERTEFFADGTYRSSVTFGPGSSTCAEGASTSHLKYVRTGIYSLGGAASGYSSSNWTNIAYHTSRIIVSPLKDNENPPFYYGGNVYCNLTTTDLLNHPVFGCPCNGTWVRTVDRNLTWTGSQACTIATCPLIYLNGDSLYGNLMLTNDTNNPANAQPLKLILSSSFATSARGYDANDTYITLVNSGAGCRDSIYGSSSTGTTRSFGVMIAPNAAIFAFTILFGVLAFLRVY